MDDQWEWFDMSGILQAILTSRGGVAQVLVNGSAVTTGTYIFNNSNTVNTIIVTGTNRAVTFSLWGAAGGNGAYPTDGSSGAGGFAKGTATLQVGTTYYLYVGQGGFGPDSYSYGNGGLGGWPNGGFGTMGDASGAGGGGMTMLSTALFSTGMSDSTILLIAGAGGGSTGYNGAAGAGGGSVGQNNSSSSTGGTQSAGGTFNGSRLTGGNATGSRTSGGDDGGGGGGGYFGGGGGTSDARPGAGGSGYFNPSLINSPTLITGSTTAAPNPDGTLNSNFANGRIDVAGSPANGRAGLAYITFS
jgi:hypothetical protein